MFIMSVFLVICLLVFAVALRVRAWIEIILQKTAYFRLIVALRVRAWIKLLYALLLFNVPIAFHAGARGHRFKFCVPQK